MGAPYSGNTSADRLAEILTTSAAIMPSSSDPGYQTSSSNGALGQTNDEGCTSPPTDANPSTGGDASASALAPVTALLDDVLGSDACNLLGGSDGISALRLAGSDGSLQPVLNVENTAVLDLHEVFETASDELGAAGVVHSVTNLGETVGLGKTGTVEHPDGHSNLLTDVLNAPGDILGGDLDQAFSNLTADISDIVNGVAGLGKAVLNGSDALNPVSDLIQDIGANLQHIPLLTINGGNNADDGGLLGGVISDLNPSSGGHLADVDIGPERDNGIALDVLGQPDNGPRHALEVNAVDQPAGSPQLADLGLLTGAGALDIPGLSGSGSDGLNIPLLNGAGIDSLTGNLLGDGLTGGDAACGDSTCAPLAVPGDIAGLSDVMTALLTTDHGILDNHGTCIV